MYGFHLLAFASAALARHAVDPRAQVPMVAPTPDAPSMPRVYQNDKYGLRSVEVPKDTCFKLTGDYYHNVGSISIPCAGTLPAGKKMICTLHQDSNCKHADANFDQVSFDHSHFRMFDSDGGSGITDVGGLSGSVSCSEVPVDTVIKKTYDHPSIRHASVCAGEKCESDTDCVGDAAGLMYCRKDKTCQRAKFIPNHERCSDDPQCAAGYCVGAHLNVGYCRPLRPRHDGCKANAECASGACCAWEEGGHGPECNDPYFCRNKDKKPCTLSGEPCWKASTCCSGTCHPSPLIIPVCK